MEKIIFYCRNKKEGKRAAKYFFNKYCTYNGNSISWSRLYDYVNNFNYEDGNFVLLTRYETIYAEKINYKDEMKYICDEYLSDGYVLMANDLSIE